MNRDLTKFGAFTINRFINGFYRGGSLEYDLECLICKCRVVQSYISESGVAVLLCETLSQVYAVTYIPFGVRGERYLAEKLKPLGETIESNNLKRLCCITKSDSVDEIDKKCFAIGSKPLSEIDLNKEIENLDWTDVPGFVFRLKNVLLDLRRADLWNTKAFGSDDEVFNAVEDNFDNTGKLAVPEEILKLFNSPEYQAYQASELSDGEKAYLDNYFDKTSFLPMDCVSLSRVYVVTYIQFGVRGERYLAEKLKPFGETIESNNLKRLYCIANSDYINEDNKKCFALGSKPLSEIDLNKEIENPDWTDVSGFVFRLKNVLFDLRRANLWNTEAFGSDDEVDNAVVNDVIFNADTTGKLAVPEEILKIYNSPEYQAYQASELSDGEKAYLDNYFDKTGFLPPYHMDTDEHLKLLKELTNKD